MRPDPKPQRPEKRRRGHNSTLSAGKPLRKRSATNAVAKAWREQYLPQRQAYLAARPFCEMRVPSVCPPYQHPATEIQHKVQRSLDPSIRNLLNEANWLPSCHAANTWASDHPQEARALGIELDPRATREEE